MSDTPRFADDTATPRRPARGAGRFPVCIGRFDDPATRDRIDALVRWIEERFRDDLRQRPSKHVYVRTLPPEVVGEIDRLRESPAIHGAIRRHFGGDCSITPMKSTDELYLSHYNKDYGGDHGLFAKHYDGNLRFLPGGAVVRALIYLQSDAAYKVVFADSRVERAFASYEFGLLDFHRELHWVEGEYRPDDRQRILLKCNYLVTAPGAAIARPVLFALNAGVFYVVKAAMEYSKSPRTLAQRAVGWVCNGARLLNNVHPLAPVALVVLAAGAAAWSVARLAL
jgi:hypothetical protein